MDPHHVKQLILTAFAPLLAARDCACHAIWPGTIRAKMVGVREDGSYVIH